MPRSGRRIPAADGGVAARALLRAWLTAALYASVSPDDTARLAYLWELPVDAPMPSWAVPAAIRLRVPLSPTTLRNLCAGRQRLTARHRIALSPVSTP